MTRYGKVVGSIVTGDVIASDTDPGAPWVAIGNAGPGWLFDGEATPPVTTPPVPAAVTMRQARLALLAIGKIDDVEAIIAALPSPQKDQALIEWNYSNEVQRSNGFVAQIGPALGLDGEALDALFIAAGAIP